MSDIRHKQVTCRQCGKSYKCTAADDYYNFKTAEDGLCVVCMPEAGFWHAAFGPMKPVPDDHGGLW